MKDTALAYFILFSSAIAFYQQSDIADVAPLPTVVVETNEAITDAFSSSNEIAELHARVNELECRVQALEAERQDVTRQDVDDALSAPQPATSHSSEPEQSPELADAERAVVIEDQLPRAILYKPRWHCPACEQWIAARSRLPVRLEVRTISDSELPYGNSYPLIKFEAKGQWWWYRPGTRDSKGRSRTVDLFIQTVNESRQGARQATRAARKTAAELRQWIRQRYRQSSKAPFFERLDGQPARGIMSPGYEYQVWEHLQDENHRFQADQVTSLEQWEALALHDAHHAEEITSE